MAKVSFPARCAVAVVCGEHLVSQVYPASVPVEAFLDNVVELLNDELKRRGFTGLESGVGYELHKANGVRLDVPRRSTNSVSRTVPPSPSFPWWTGNPSSPSTSRCRPAWPASA